MTKVAVPETPGKATTSTDTADVAVQRAWATARPCSNNWRLRIGPAPRP
ncbi:hypothetical protein [Cyanobium sp. BA20m-p-22]|nr:hypothetical protein [Cyanobium sp. BA20m-p-22]